MSTLSSSVEDSPGSPGVHTPLTGSLETDTYGTTGLYVTAASYCIPGTLLMVNYVYYVLEINAMFPHDRGMGAKRLWGTLLLPQNTWLFNVWNASVLLAIIGYFPMLLYTLYAVGGWPKQTVHRINGFYLGYMLPSQLWMPLCAMYLRNPTSLIYWAIRAQLFLCGCSLVVWAVCTLQAPRPQNLSSAIYICSVAGTCWFAFHCFFFDGILWSPYFAAGIGCEKCFA